MLTRTTKVLKKISKRSVLEVRVLTGYYLDYRVEDLVLTGYYLDYRAEDLVLTGYYFGLSR